MTEVLGGTAGSAVLILALVAVAHLALRWYARRRCRLVTARASGNETPAEQSTREWAIKSILSLVAPVCVLLWIQGLRYAISILPQEVTEPWFVHYAVPALELLYGVATIAALIWLLARAGRAIEARLIA